MKPVCGWVWHSLTCDREPGHDGPHRGYHEILDAVLFWHDTTRERTNRKGPADDETRTHGDAGAGGVGPGGL